MHVNFGFCWILNCIDMDVNSCTYLHQVCMSSHALHALSLPTGGSIEYQAMQSMYMLHVVSCAMDGINFVQVEHLASVPCSAGAVYMKRSMSNTREYNWNRETRCICARTTHSPRVASAYSATLA